MGLAAVEQSIRGFRHIHIDRGIQQHVWHVSAIRHEEGVGLVGRRITVPADTPAKEIREQLLLAYAGQLPQQQEVRVRKRR